MGNVYDIQTIKLISYYPKLRKNQKGDIYKNLQKITLSTN